MRWLPLVAASDVVMPLCTNAQSLRQHRFQFQSHS